MNGSCSGLFPHVFARSTSGFGIRGKFTKLSFLLFLFLFLFFYWLILKIGVSFLFGVRLRGVWMLIVLIRRIQPDKQVSPWKAGKTVSGSPRRWRTVPWIPQPGCPDSSTAAMWPTMRAGSRKACLPSFPSSLQSTLWCLWSACWATASSCMWSLGEFTLWYNKSTFYNMSEICIYKIHRYLI